MPDSAGLSSESRCRILLPSRRVEEFVEEGVFAPRHETTKTKINALEERVR